MEQTVLVRKTYADGTAQVVHIRQSACSGDCHKCAGCGAAQETLLLTVKNPIGAKPGDRVVITTKSGPVLAAAAVLYLMPVLLFFIGYLAGEVLWKRGALTGCAAFFCGIALAAVYDRKLSGKNTTEYTITGYPAGTPREPMTKGENDLD